MSLKIPFQVTDWADVPVEEIAGTTGMARVRTVRFEDPEAGHGLRIRMMELSAGFLLDHLCEVGHLVFVLEGEMINELHGGETRVMGVGKSFAVSDGLSVHRIRTNGPAKLLIVDGAFLE
ncbi:MAG: DHCW motif cupin fold protein [Flavobacteriales bacterium]|nr:DHCW motif cupin fold protein [Flavobacteriales bacterium]